MSIPSASLTTGRGQPLRRGLRRVLRLSTVVLLLIIGMPLALICLNPLAKRTIIGGMRVDHFGTVHWSRALMRVCGIRVIVEGQPVAPPAMFVANHRSWTDIQLIHNVRAAHFVAKAEIARWPLIGQLATYAGTIFHQRGSTDSLSRVAQTVGERLTAGETVAIFPEGRVSTSDIVLPFHARLFRLAIETGSPVQPVAIQFERNGQQAADIPFRQNESFLANALRILGEPASQARLTFLPAIDTSERTRSDIARTARAAIVDALDASSAITS